MKLTAVLLLACCLQVASAATAQKVTLSKDKASLKNVFAEIKRQTGYAFFYNARLLENAGNVNIDVKNAPLEEVLELCFKDQPLTYHIVNKTIVISAKEVKTPPLPLPEAAPPTVDISGKITEENGTPIEGASVVVKGSSRGTMTDRKGAFKLSDVLPGTVLTISFVGYTNQEITVKDGSSLSIKLVSQAKDPLTSVVITGYQQIRKESYTGTSTTVSGEDLKKVNPQNVLRSLQVFDPSFKIAENNLLGSNPNRLPNINVRGSTALPSGSSADVISRSNLSGNSNLPTFIMDGYEVSLQKIYDLDVNRIQSITLLKDAAATAVYGSRAANGVVVITTKPPKSGKLQATYNYELNVTTPDLSAYSVLNASQKLEYERLAGVYDANINQALSQDQLDEQYYHKKALVVGGVNTYWLSQPLQTTFGQKHSVYVEGGENSVRYGLAARYQTMPGVMKGSGRDRYSTELYLSYNMGSKLLFKNTITITQTKSKESPYGDFENYVKMNPYYAKTDSTGHVAQIVDKWTDRTSGNGGITTYYTLNPMYNATLGSFDKSSYLELIDAFSGDWSITPSLRLRGQITLNKTQTTSDNFLSPFANEYFSYSGSQLTDRGSYQYGNIDETTVDGNLTLNYNKQVGVQYFNAMVGSNIRTYLSNEKDFEATGFTNDRFSNIGFANSYKKLSQPYSYLNRERLAGLFTSVNYSYDNKYLLDFTIRADGSSKFGSENKIAPFASFGLGWNMHKEAFLQGTAISRLKLRATTGLTGSVSFDSYKSKTTYEYYTGNWYSTGVGAHVISYGNDNLQWQKTRNYDLGLELGLFHDRLLIMPRYYTKLTRGLLADVSIPPSTGFSSYTANVGDMRNTGQELNIQYTAIKTNNLVLSVFANLVRNKNIIVKVSNTLKSYNDKADSLQTKPENKGVPLLRYNEGQSLDAIYAVRSLGIDPENGKEILVKKDGTLTYVWDARDIVPVGVSTPKGEGYFGTNVTYKQFNMSLSFYTRFGGELYNQTLVDRVENANPRYNVDSRVLDARWKQRGDRTFYKNIADLGNTDVTSRFVQKDNVLELQSFYLSYDVSRALYSKAGMRSLRLAFTMNDVWRWASVKQERGIDYPYARSFTFSLQTSF